MVTLSTMSQDNSRYPSQNELQYGFTQLVQHNPNTAYHQTGQEFLSSNLPLASYDSPIVGRQLISPQTNAYVDGSFANTYPSLHSPPSIGLGIQYNPYGSPQTGYYQTDQYGYSVPYLTNGSQHAYPLTPQSTDSDVGRNTQSGRSSLNRSDGSSVLKNDTRGTRVTKSPKPRKPKANKSSSANSAPEINAPLSELTKDMTDIPLRDMEEWVNRSIEERLKEVETNKNGKVPRPMNSFMLYRSAYTERTKKYCAQHNHQVVSKVSGASWKFFEPPHIKKKYNDLAQIERANHARAHPEYKFSPSKVGASSSSRRRKDNASTDDEDEDDDELYEQVGDFEWKPRNERRARQTRRQTDSQSAYSPRVDDFDQHFGPNSGNNRSAWEATNDGKPLPAQIGSNDMYHQYYQTSIHLNMTDPHVEDVRIQQVQAPGTVATMPIGVPGSYREELFSASETGTPVHYEQQVDPSLFQMMGQYNHNGADTNMMDQAMSFDENDQLYSHSFEGSKGDFTDFMGDSLV